MKKINFLIALTSTILINGCLVKQPSTPNECVEQAKQILNIVKDTNYSALEKYLKKIGYWEDSKALGFTMAEKNDLKEGTFLLNKYGVPEGNSLKIRVDTLSVAGRLGNKNIYNISVKISFFFTQAPDSMSKDYFDFIYFNKIKEGYKIDLFKFNKLHITGNDVLPTFPK